MNTLRLANLIKIYETCFTIRDEFFIILGFLRRRRAQSDLNGQPAFSVEPTGPIYKPIILVQFPLCVFLVANGLI